MKKSKNWRNFYKGWDIAMSENVKLPDGWKRVRLGEVIERIGDGGTPPRSDKTNFDGDIPWVVIEDIKKRIYDTKEKLTKKGLKYSNAKIWRKGSIILSFGATIGVVGIAEVDLATKQGIAGMELKNDEVFNLFLYFVLTTKKNELLRLANQTTILEVRPNVFVNKLSFLLPPLPEQRKIAEILETIDNAIEKTDAIIEKYKRIKQGLMQDLLTKGVVNEGEGESERWRLRDENIDKFKDSPLGRIPEEWEVVRLGDMVVKSLGGDWGKENKENNQYIEAFVLRGTDLPKAQGGDFSNVQVRYLKENSFKNRKLIKGDILIELSGGSDDQPVGRIYIHLYDHVERVCFSNFVRKLVVDQNRVIPKYFYWYWLYLYNLGRTAIYERRTTGIRNFKYKDFLDNEKIPLPLIPEQERIATILSQIDEVIEKEQAYKEKLERIKKGLMEDLLTGKVRVNHLIEEGNKDGN